jgi:hypothetical protein
MSDRLLLCVSRNLSNKYWLFSYAVAFRNIIIIIMQIVVHRVSDLGNLHLIIMHWCYGWVYNFMLLNEFIWNKKYELTFQTILSRLHYYFNVFFLNSNDFYSQISFPIIFFVYLSVCFMQSCAPAIYRSLYVVSVHYVPMYICTVLCL